jgi:8-oxo-dGTP diphosphatase
MAVGHFIAGVAAVIWSPTRREYLLLHRSEHKDFGRGVWECLTGRVEQGEGFEDALHREVREELGVEITVEYILGTTHFYRGTTIPENELVGVVYLCSMLGPNPIQLSAEHSEYRWLPSREALELLSATDPSTQWARRVLERAELIRPLISADLVGMQRQAGFELG